MSMTLAGLEGVVVAETELSDVDGERGHLIVRGYEIEDLVGQVTFEEAWALLWTGRLPSASERDDWRARIARGRQDTFALIPSIGNALALPDGMDALRAALGHLTATGDLLRDGLFLTGAAAVFAAAWARGRANQAPVEPDPSLSHAADYIRMIHGGAAPPAGIDGLDAYLCCVIDHGLNASTLAARVVASTGSDLVSAVVAAVGALKGPLHGGAPGPALDMVFEIGDVGRAEPVLRRKIEAGERLMGFGHRVYKVRDPRAGVLAAAAERMLGPGDALYDLARGVEAVALRLLEEYKPGRRLQTNVEYYTALLLHGLGLETPLFTPTFAISRVAGWIAHCFEQRAANRLIRPQSVYVGARGRRWPETRSSDSRILDGGP
jgi:citrate synthase